jgi:ribonuclease HIII
MLEIGADEVGSGDTFCGLVVSAVCLDDHQMGILKEKNIRDCKKISDSMIGQYVGWMTELGVRHSTMALDPDRLNGLLTDKVDHVKIQNLLYHKAITSLIQKVGNPDKIFIDQFPGANITVDHLDISMVPRADENQISVAAASIMARSTYLGMRKSLGKELGMEIPLGSSNVRGVLKQLINMEVDISRYAKMYPNNVKAVLRENR